jgi:DNA-binding PadR family transcriptional regulator
MRSSETETLVLICLLDGPKHGYAIGDDLKDLLGQRPGPGTLYGAIARLEQSGLIAQRASDDRRKPYALTGAGADRAKQAVAKVEAVAREGRRRLRARQAT